jgi:hypothetical protein
VDVLVIAAAVPETPEGFAAVGGVNTIRMGVLKFARFSLSIGSTTAHSRKKLERNLVAKCLLEKHKLRGKR